MSSSRYRLLLGVAEPIDVEHMSILQDLVHAEFNRRHAVIETLPTKNVRISFYHTYAKRHVFRWLGFHSPGLRVTVCFGSDDPGIFNTNLRNEYVHLLRELDRRCAGTQRDTYAELKTLIENGKIWRFAHP